MGGINKKLEKVHPYAEEGVLDSSFSKGKYKFIINYTQNNLIGRDGTE